MKKTLLTLSIALGATFSQAQNVGIGTSSPNSSAKLDINASDKGVLFPNVALTGTSDASTISTPATGLIVWNTGSGGLSPAGFYYNAGTTGSPNWTKVANGAVLTNTLTDGRILIGNGSNIATEQTMSGDATINNTGVLDLSNNAVETSEINDAAVTTVKIADNAVTGGKIDISGNANGSLMYYDGTDWVNLAPGTSGQVLRTNGAGAPTWSNGNDIFTFENGLTETLPNIVRLGGALTQPTTISSLTATNKMSFTGAGVDAFNVDGTTFSIDATNDRVGIGLNNPNYKLDVAGDIKASGNFILNNASPTVYFQDNDHRAGMIHVNSNLMYFLTANATNSLTWAVNGSYWPLYIDLTNDDLVFGGRGLFMEGNVGIGTAAPAVKLAVGGDGTDVYQTDLWVERNIHVRGNEDLTQIAGTQYGRLRVGSAWGYNGLYTDGASDGSGNDLVLGASSGVVRIGPDNEPGGQNLQINGELRYATHHNGTSNTVTRIVERAWRGSTTGTTTSSVFFDDDFVQIRINDGGSTGYVQFAAKTGYTGTWSFASADGVEVKGVSLATAGTFVNTTADFNNANDGYCFMMSRQNADTPAHYQVCAHHNSSAAGSSPDRWIVTVKAYYF